MELEMKSQPRELKMVLRFEILAPVLALLLTGDVEIAKLWYSVWYFR